MRPEPFDKLRGAPSKGPSGGLATGKQAAYAE